jgi:hypothetical protein
VRRDLEDACCFCEFIHHRSGKEGRWSVMAPCCLNHSLLGVRCQKRPTNQPPKAWGALRHLPGFLLPLNEVVGQQQVC